MSYALAKLYSKMHSGKAIAIMKDGVLTAWDGDIDVPFDLQSGSKSYIGVTAVKLAKELGTTLDGLMSVHVPAWTTGNLAKRTCSVRKMLSMQGGMPGGTIGSAETYEAAAGHVIQNTDINTFSYGPRPFQTYGAYLKDALGGQDPADYIQTKVLPESDLIDHWDYAAPGEPLLAHGAHTTAAKWAAWGEYLRNEIPKDPALQSLVTPSLHYPAYGCTFWLTQGDWLAAVQGKGNDANQMPGNGYAAWGYGNQRLYILPEQGMVVARFGTQGPWDDATFLNRLLT